ncbi:dihydropteroate synthase [Lishizhenia sp.]|uniref:dihydropteroate synthase n=1 Tax=Lishizhenia sp. TaxID=2497594 RepID=UPI00299D5867|nr:dihydropteroate synthase [Lishizhenia sp.]MDX1446572.1 dihydropteroate synthase [Lishizhenia sp.]
MKDKNNKISSLLHNGDKVLDLSTPRVMGILNLTQDSFYEPSRNQSTKELLTTVEKMLQDGADILDLGAYSTRPGAIEVPLEAEAQRVQEAVTAIRKNFGEVWISVDTFRSEVAQRGIDQGADIINDVSGGTLDEHMFATVAKNQVPYILMHMRGTPQTMQSLCNYDNLVEDIYEDLMQKVRKLNALQHNNIILDLGYGFAKTLDQNYELLAHQNKFTTMGYPILTGISRKSMIYKALDITAAESLSATTALNMFALNKGANILRVHDVKEAKQVVELNKRLHQ